MQRPNVELGYTVKTIPQGPTFPAGQLHEISIPSCDRRIQVHPLPAVLFGVPGWRH